MKTLKLMILFISVWFTRNLQNKLLEKHQMNCSKNTKNNNELFFSRTCEEISIVMCLYSRCGQKEAEKDDRKRT